MINKNRDRFITQATSVHENKFSYDKVVYKNLRTKVIITCPIHGDFEQTPESHLSGHGCRKCANEQIRKIRSKTNKTFIEESSIVHNNKYDYSNVMYINNHTKVLISCPLHGEFWQTPDAHLRGQGCPECKGSKISQKLTKKQSTFIKEATQTHSNLYDYSKVEYKNTNSKVCIICPIHGEFWQTPNHHLKGEGCPHCFGNVCKTTEDFIKEAKEIHGDKYYYSKVTYVNNRTKVCIICPAHGEFWQAPYKHLNRHGCPKCKKSLLEIDVEKALINSHIKFEQQKTFDWLIYKRNLKLDFYLPEYNIAIECQGEQHYRIAAFTKSLEESQHLFETIQIRDNVKKKLCEKYNLPLFYIKYDDNVQEAIDNIISNVHNKKN